MAEGRRGGQRVALSAAALVYSFALHRARGRRVSVGCAPPDETRLWCSGQDVRPADRWRSGL